MTIVEQLAERYPQLYVAPAEDAEEAYRVAAGSGQPPAQRSLAHFITSEDDWLRLEQTPAGSVDALFLKERRDFETFLQCTLHRCRPDAIPATIGAMTIQGLPDWSRIFNHRAEYLAGGGQDWAAEFKRFVAKPENYRTTIVIVSEGPYSALSAQAAGYDDRTWLELSRDIRLYHELTHVTCRRLMPGDTPAVFDEVTADFSGLVHATGTYDPMLALRFLGIDGGVYVGGRLEEYLNDEQRANIATVAGDVSDVCERIAELSEGVSAEDAYEFVLKLKRERLLDY